MLKNIHLIFSVMDLSFDNSIAKFLQDDLDDPPGETMSPNSDSIPE